MCLQGKEEGWEFNGGNGGTKQTCMPEWGCICKGLRMRVSVFVGRGGGRTLLEVGCVKPTEGGN